MLAEVNEDIKELFSFNEEEICLYSLLKGGLMTGSTLRQMAMNCLLEMAKL